jgi:class 3 adenylate cyclase
MTEQAPEGRADPRLAKAGEIFDFLRLNPAETSRDPEDLAMQFDADPLLVDRLLRTRVISQRRVRRPRFSLKKLLKDTGSLIVRAVVAVTVQPYLFLIVVALLFVITGAFSVVSVKVVGDQLGITLTSGPGAFAMLIFISSQMLCLFVRPRFKILFVAMINSFLAFAVLFGVMRISGPAHVSRTIVTVGGSLALTILVGLVGLGVLLAGGMIEVAGARNKDAALSRQELLTRMFELQAQLAELPPAKARRPNVHVQRLRKNLAWWSVLSGFAFELASLAFDARNQSLLRSAKPQTATPAVLSAAVSLAALCGLAYVAANLRRGLLVISGVALGSVAACAVMLASRSVADLTLQSAGLHVGAQTVFNAAVVAVMLYGLFIQRELARLRREGSPNETSVIAELVDVHHRLAAASVKVYVMAVDVVGSTKMKDGADPLLAEFSFRSFQDWLASVAAKHGGKVDAMTGDGAIIAFGTGSNAIACAVDLQCSSSDFNEQKNRLRTPFRFRISLHAGLVVGELDKVQFTEVIDVAAHVEKLSPIGGFAATLDFLKELSEPLAGAKQGPIMDGRQVYLCEPADMALTKR